MNKNNPLTLTVSLTDPALNLTVKRIIHFDAQDRPSETATLTADALEELHSLLAIAQNQSSGFQQPIPYSEFPRCPLCARITKGFAATLRHHVPDHEICHCPNPPLPIECPNCGLPYHKQNTCWVPHDDCHCFEYTTPIRSDGTAVMPDGSVIKVDPTIGQAR